MKVLHVWSEKKVTKNSDHSFSRSRSLPTTLLLAHVHFSRNSFFHFPASFDMFFTSLILFLSVSPSFGVQELRTLRLSQIIHTKYQCIDQGCSPLTSLYLSSLRACQITCLSETQCRTATFYQSQHRCDLFADIPDHFGSFSEQANAVSMTATDNRKLSARKWQQIAWSSREMVTESGISHVSCACIRWSSVRK